MNIKKKINIQGKDVLIVDDNSMNLQVIGNILKDYNLHLRFALNAEKALNSISHKKPDLLLLDINMPRMDGFELCSKLKESEDTSDIPVIFITAARKDDESIVTGFKVGAIDYITKPFNPEELIARITSQLHLKTYRDYLELVINEKNRMFSIFAHDIRNPFSSILGISELSIMQGDKLPKEKLLSNMEMINKSGEKIYQLLQDLTSWIGIQSDMLEFKPQQIELGKTFDKVVNLFSQIASEKKISIIYPTVDISVWADKAMFETILRNFVNNAIKFTRQSGTIELSIEEKHDFILIKIEDNGVGMSQETVSKLLTNMLNTATYGTTNEKGTGLGIGICKEMIAKNGGKLFIESTLDKGTTISFTLPCYASQDKGV